MVSLSLIVGVTLSGCLMQRDSGADGWNSGTDGSSGPEDALSVAEALADAASSSPEAPEVQTTPVTVYGRVENLGAFFCPCFEIRSDGKALLVRHGLFPDEELQDLDVSNLRNGDTVLVSGLLRTSAGLAPELWATAITPLD